MQGFGGQVADEDPEVHVLGNAGTTNDHFMKLRNSVPTGANGGFQAIALALLAGAGLVVLVGYDMRAVDGKTNWHSDTDPHRTPTDAQWYSSVYARMFDSLRGHPIVNATPGSALNTFKKVPLESVLPHQA